MSALGKFISPELYAESSVMVESYSSQGALPSNLNNPSTFNQFNIQSSGVDNGRSCVLEVTLSNNGTTSVCIFTPGLLSFIQIGLGAGSQLFSETIYGESIWADISNYSSSKLAEVAQMMGFNASTLSFAANTIAPAATATFSIPIDCLLTRCSLPISYIPMIQVRTYWSSNGIATSSLGPASSVSVSNLQLYLMGQKFSPDVKLSLFKQLQSGKIFKFKTYVAKLQVVAQSSSSTAANSVITGTMSNFAGIYSNTSFYLRPYAATAEKLIGFDYTNALTPTNFKGTSTAILGSGRVSLWSANLSYNQGSLVVPAIYYDSPWFSVMTNFSNYTWTDSPVQSNWSGVERGLQSINTTFLVQTSPVATLASGYDLVVVAHGLSFIQVQGENITVSTFS